MESPNSRAAGWAEGGKRFALSDPLRNKNEKTKKIPLFLFGKGVSTATLQGGYAGDKLKAELFKYRLSAVHQRGRQVSTVKVRHFLATSPNGDVSPVEKREPLNCLSSVPV